MIELAVIVVLLAMALLFLRWFSAPPKVREPRCAQCGYDVRGLSRGVCPECGGDLSKPDAILVPGARATESLASRLCAWTVVCLIIGMISSAIAAEVPRSLKQRYSWRVTLAGQPSFGYQRLEVNVSDRAWRERDLQPRHGTITMQRVDGTTVTVPFNLIDKTMGDPASSNACALNEANLRDWLVRSGAVGTAGQLDYQARALFAVATTLDINAAINVAPHDDWTPIGAGGRQLALLGGGSSSGGGPVYSPRHARRFAAALFLGVWLLGCVTILRRAQWRNVARA